MPILKMPDGVDVDFGDMPDAQIKNLIRSKFPDFFPDKSGMMNAAKAGLRGGVGAVETLGGDIAGKLGYAGAQNYLQEAANNQKKQAADTFEPTTSEDTSNAFDRGILPGLSSGFDQYIGEPVGGMVGRFAPSVAAGAAGSAVAGPIGGIAAFGAVEGSAATGENLERQQEVNPGQDTDLTSATIAGLVQAALARFGLGKYIGGALGSQVAAKEAAKWAPEVIAGRMTKEEATKKLGGTLRNVIAETASNAAVGTGMMAGTEVARQAQAGQDVNAGSVGDALQEGFKVAGPLSPLFGLAHGLGAKGTSVKRFGQDEQQFKANEQLPGGDNPAGSEAAFRTQQAEKAASDAAAAKEVQDMAAIDAKLKAQQEGDKQTAFDAQVSADNLRAAQQVTAEAQAAQANAGTRADATDAFTQPMDMEGNLRPTPEPAPPAPEPRPDFQLQPDSPQMELPLEPTAQRATDTPALIASTGPAPNLTTANMFDGVVRPQAAVVKRGELVGHDLNTVNGVQNVVTRLKKYQRNLPDSEANAPYHAAIDAKVAELRARIAQLKLPVPTELPLEGAHMPTEAQRAMLGGRPDAQMADALGRNTPRPANNLTDAQRAFADLRPDPETAAAVRMKPGEPNADIQANRVQPEPVERSTVSDLGSGQQGAGLPPALPEAGRGRNGRGDGPVGTDVPAEKTAGDALATTRDLAQPEPPATPPLKEQQVSRFRDFLSSSDEAKAKSGVTKEQMDLMQKSIDAFDAKPQPEVKDTPEQRSSSWDQAIAQGNLPAPVQDAVMKGGKLNDTLGALAKHGSTKEIRDLADKLSKLELDTKINPGKYRDAQGAEHPGVFNRDKNSVLVDPVRATEHVVLHEAVHAATTHAFDKGAKLTPDQRAATQEIKKIYADLKKSGKLDDQYGITNVREFVAEVHTNPEFQAAIRANRSLWNRLVDAVRRIVGMKSNDVVDRAMRANETIMEGAKDNQARDGATTGRMDPAPANPAFDGFKQSEYNDSVLEKAVRAVGDSPAKIKALTKPGTKAWLSNAYSHAVQAVADRHEGQTRWLEQGATKRVNGAIQATARFLQQHSEYWSQLGRVASEHGTMIKNREGSWVTADRAHNLRTLNESINKLPDALGEDKRKFVNGFFISMSYAEREAKATTNRAKAVADIAKAKQDLATAKKTLKPNEMIKVVNRSNKIISNARKMIANSHFKRPPGVTDASITYAKQMEAQYPEVRAMRDEVHGIINNMIETREAAGLNTPQEIADFRANKYYVPLFREMGEVVSSRRSNGGRAGATTKSDRHFNGSEKDVKDVLANLVDAQLELSRKAMRNDADLHTLQDLAALPTNPAGVMEYKKRLPGTGNFVTVKDKGENRFFKVDDPHAFKAFQDIVAVSPNAGMKIWEAATVILRESVMLGPDAVLRNMVRDNTDAVMFGYTNKNLASMSAGSAKTFAQSWPGIIQEARTGKSHMPNRNVIKVGIVGSREYTSGNKESEKIIYDFMRETKQFSGPQSIAAGTSKAIDIAHHVLQSFAAEAEISTREQVYNETLARTGSLTEAASAAINTMDFRRRGDMAAVSYAKVMIPFFNSQVQGVYKLVNVLARGDNAGTTRADATKALLQKGLMMTAMTGAYYAMLSSDPNFAQVSKQNKDNAWLVPIGGGQYFKIPLNFELAALFKTLPENVIRMMLGEQSGRETAHGIGLALANNFAPSVIPQAVKPIIEVATDHDFFTDKPIESDPQKKLEATQRSNANTSSTAKSLSKGLGGALSPLQIDHLMQGYTTTLGTVLTKGIDSLIEIGDKNPKASTNISRMPLFKSFTTDPTHSDAVDRFYALRQMTQEVAATTRQYQNDGKLQEMQAYLQKKSPTGVTNRQMLALNQGVSATEGIFKQARTAQHAIDINPNLSASQKRIQKDQLTKRVNTIIERQMPMLRKMSGE